MRERTRLVSLNAAELEMIEHSVAKRLQTWKWTEEYLRTGSADGLTEVCHKLEEAQWVLAQYVALHRRIAEMLTFPATF